MLGKSLKNFYFDAHFHYSDSKNAGCFDSFEEWYGCSCAHSQEEWEAQNSRNDFIKAYGLHPQSAGFIDIEKNAFFLEELCKTEQIHAIGEMGFDYFTDEYKAHKELQEKMFRIQLQLALKYNLPVVVHCRKANEKLFEYKKEFSKLPAVLFHSFMGSPVEAVSLINHEINAYFSFGKQLMNDNKKVIACAEQLPLERLLLETDAPFQYLKGENNTCISDIKKIYERFIEIRIGGDEGIPNKRDRVNLINKGDRVICKEESFSNKSDRVNCNSAQIIRQLEENFYNCFRLMRPLDKSSSFAEKS